MKVSCDSD